MLTRTERILLALQSGPMTVKDAMVHLSCEEKEACNAIAKLAKNGRAKVERKGRFAVYHITETGRQKIEDMERSELLSAVQAERAKVRGVHIEVPKPSKEAKPRTRAKPISARPMTRAERMMVQLLSGPRTSTDLAKLLGCTPIQSRKTVSGLIETGRISGDGPHNGKVYTLTGSGRLEAQDLNQCFEPEPIVVQALRVSPVSVWAYAQALA